MKNCKLCPRMCEINRAAGQLGFCKGGSVMRISRAAPHFWEEPVISGEKGSGTVFFSGCSLRCVYCQNYEISSNSAHGQPVSVDDLRRIFAALIKQGVHNINLVNPTHYASEIRKALLAEKLPVPIVYNSSGYERVKTLKSLEGLIDIYLPDYKYANDALGEKLSGVPDYSQIAESAISEMIRQAGKPVIQDGLMRKGTIIRHLILPMHTQNSISVLGRIAALFPETLVSVMAQYTPCGKAADYPEINRGITKREYEKVRDVLFDLELDGFLQDGDSVGKGYVPDFDEGLLRIFD